MPSDLTQLGISGLTLGILFVIVRYFISALTKKDEQITQIVKEFSVTISNHMEHQTKSFEKQAHAFSEVVIAIQEIMSRTYDVKIGKLLDKKIKQNGHGK